MPKVDGKPFGRQGKGYHVYHQACCDFVNLIECQGQARPLLRCEESYGAVLRNNTLTNVSDTDRYDNPRSDARAGLETPLKFECGVHGEFTVDAMGVWPIRQVAQSGRPRRRGD